MICQICQHCICFIAINKRPGWMKQREKLENIHWNESTSYTWMRWMTNNCNSCGWKIKKWISRCFFVGIVFVSNKPIEYNYVCNNWADRNSKSRWKTTYCNDLNEMRIKKTCLFRVQVDKKHRGKPWNNMNSVLLSCPLELCSFQLCRFIRDRFS